MPRDARDVVAVVPAAGTGRRLGSRRTKTFVTLAGKPLLLHALEAFQQTPAVRWIVVVVRPTDRARVRALARRHHLTKVAAIVPGGSSRAESVARGMAALPDAARWVIIHDGARPCVNRRLIESIIAYVKRHKAVACGLPAALTVKAVDHDGTVRLTLDRDQLSFIQTPQAFHRDWVQDALRRVGRQLDHFPDDAAILEWAGFPVHIVPGDPLNIKVTTKEDLLLAETILKHRGQK